MWRCPNCETLNSDDFSHCDVCDEARHTSISYASQSGQNLGLQRSPATKTKSNGGSSSAPLTIASILGNKKVILGLALTGLLVLCGGCFALSVKGLLQTISELVAPVRTVQPTGLVIEPTAGYPTATYSLKSTTPIQATSTTSYQPTLTPAVHISPSETKETLEQSITPEQFIRDYFSAINNRQYDLTWSMLSAKFQANHASFNEYKSWWDTVDKVETILIETKSQNDSEAYIYVEAYYHYKRGAVTTGHTTYKLIKNESGNSWLFDPK